MIWDVLGIHPTNNTDEIKKAYSKLAKQFNPEEYPDEFSRIHDAFKEAMKFARCRNNAVVLPDRPQNDSDQKLSIKENIRSENKSTEKPEYIFCFNDIFNENKEDKNIFSFVDDICSSAKVSENKKNVKAEDVLDEMRKIIKDADLYNSIYVWKSLFSNKEVKKILQDPQYFKSVDSVIERVRFNKQVADELKESFGNGAKIVYNYEYDVYYVDLTGKRKPEYYTLGAKKYKLKIILRYVILFLLLTAFILMFIAACFY